MRAYIFIAWAAACIFAISLQASAQLFDPQNAVADSINPKVVAVLDAFPGGGQGLREAIAGMVETEPSLTNDVVLAANIANSYQWQAIRLGLGDAVNFFTAIGSSAALGAAQRIQTALGPLNPDTGVTLSPPANLLQDIPGFSNTGTSASGSASGCISPSRPGC